MITWEASLVYFCGCLFCVFLNFNFPFDQFTIPSSITSYICKYIMKDEIEERNIE